MNRLFWRLHQIDPARPEPKRLQYPGNREALAAYLREQTGLQAALAREEVADLCRFSENIDVLTARIVRRVHDLGSTLPTLPGCAELTAAKLISEAANVDRFPNESVFARHGGLVECLRNSMAVCSRMFVMTAAALPATDEQRAVLERMASSTSLPHRQVVQARGLVLACAGVANEEIARRCAVDSDTVRRWRSRFAEQGPAGVGKIAKGRGRRPSLPAGTVEEVLRLTHKERPADGSTQWSTRTLAARLGIGKDAVAKIWADHNLKPWKVDTFKVSNDPRFEDKLVDVVGLYLNPPARAAVFCFDEKTQCQALDRTQPSLPMKPGRAGTMTHDYKRNGTIDLFAAMNIATGQVLTDLRNSHTGADVLRFFRQIDAAVPADLDVHVILDNLSAHSTPEIAKWLAHNNRRRWQLHFTPTSSSWLNLIERWFKELTDKRLRRGTFTSVTDLSAAITTWAEHWNIDPRPFVWKATAEDIIAKVQRGRETLHQIKSQTEH